MNNNAMNTAPAATPVMIQMRSDTFLDWLHEVQGGADGELVKPPHFRIEDPTEPGSPYCDIEVYLYTSEGTILARHLRAEDMVHVTIRDEKPGPNLMRTVRWMLGEDGEAA